MADFLQSKYLVCVDNSDVARNALRFACIKAQRRNIRIDLLHVIAPSEVQMMSAVEDAMKQEQQQEAEALLSSMAQDICSIYAITPTLLIRHGNPVEEILAQTLEDYYTNMIVLGVNPQSSGGRRVSSALTNQHGDKLLVPIMLVPGNMTDAQMHDLA